MPNQCPPNAAPAATGFVHFSNQTLRQIVHTSIGGSRMRVVLSNKYGTTPLAIGAAHVALRDKEASIQPASARPLTFSGRPTFTIPPGAVVYSDPVNLTVPPMSDLAIDLFLPGDTNTPAPLTMHNGAFQTSYVSEAGNHAGAANLPTTATTQNWFVVHRVEVAAPARSAASSPSATRLPTARARRRTPTTAGPIISCDGCCRRRRRSGWAS